ncbi:MAG: DedA family protein, partial [Desulfobacterales bacterium]|nr:DedA family protein [Desulfobacterales bacterium]
MSSLLTIISDYPKIAYGVVFLISLSESLAFVGILIPGTVLMLGIGVLIATGYLSLKPTIVLAVAGAIAGDGISYWLGRHYHQRLRDLWPFRKHPMMLARGEAFFNRHGGKSILMGRFIGPIRPVIPIVAGMLDMKPSRFIPVNILSGVGWAFAYVLPGVFFGTSLAVVRDVSTRLVVLLFLVAVVLWLAVTLFRRLFFFLAVKGATWLSFLEAWIASDVPVQGVRRYIKRGLIVAF